MEWRYEVKVIALHFSSSWFAVIDNETMDLIGLDNNQLDDPSLSDKILIEAVTQDLRESVRLKIYRESTLTYQGLIERA